MGIAKIEVGSILGVKLARTHDENTEKEDSHEYC